MKLSAKAILALALIGVLLLAGCQETPAEDTAGTTSSSSSSVTTTTTTTTSGSTTTTEGTSMTTTKAPTTTTTKARTTTTTTTTTKAPTTTTTAAAPDYSVLKGKTFYIFGDSYVQGHTLGVNNTWSKLFADKYSMTYGNYGLNGNGFVNGYKGDPMPERYTVVPTGADILMVIGGRNDYNLKTPLGTENDTSATTFGGALNTLITRLQAAHPDTLILFSTPWYVNGDLQKYSNMILAVCAKRGIPCFDASEPSLSGVYMTHKEWRETYCMAANDTDHLNAEGMKLVMPRFEKFIGDQYIQYLKNKD